jgi:hypothetical protein
VQAHLLARVAGNFQLQEFLIRIDLDRKEIGNAQNARQFPEILADTLLFSERIRNACYSDCEELAKKTNHAPAAGHSDPRLARDLHVRQRER